MAKYILDGSGDGKADSPPMEVAMAFKSRWELREPFHGLGQFCSGEKVDNEVFRCLISAAEVCENLGAIKKGTPVAMAC